ncbi:MAG: SO_0444 family Cu/Zn efflux transporter [Bacteroidaceae bacterium]|nr:SO_0444 family Cu/Zn efflux transporter [Bacteroidaceae bacterium]
MQPTCKKNVVTLLSRKKNRTVMLNDIWQLFNEMAPYLLLGFLMAGLMHEFVPAKLYSNYLSGQNFRSVMYAALFGIPLPLCSCGVIPTAMGLRREGASRGATCSFLIATPQTGIDSIAATYSLMGLPFALLRPFVAFVTAIFGGVLINSFDCDSSVDSSATPNHSNENHSHKSVWERIVSALRYAFLEMVEDIGRWLIVGLLIAGLITAIVPDEWFAAFRDNSLMSMLLVLSISIPMYVCATGSIPIAVALMMKGLTPGAALVLLMAGPACNTASILVVHKVLGRRTLCLYLTAIVSGAIVSGLFIDALLPREWFTTQLQMVDGCCHGASSSFFNNFCSALLTLLLVRAFWPFGSKHHHCHDEACHCHEHHHSAVYSIQGMNCSHCAATVEQAIAALPGVERVTVSLGGKSAEVEGDVEESAVRKAVENVGFNAQKL